MKKVKLWSVQENALQRQRAECYKNHGWVTSECHVKKKKKKQCHSRVLQERAHLCRAVWEIGCLFWEIRRCWSSQGILFWQKGEGRSKSTDASSKLWNSCYCCLTFTTFLSGPKFPSRMPPEGKAITLPSLSCFFPLPSTNNTLFNCN